MGQSGSRGHTRYIYQYQQGCIEPPKVNEPLISPLIVMKMLSPTLFDSDMR